MKHEDFVHGIELINENCYGDNGSLRVKSDIHVGKYYNELKGKVILIPESDKHDEVISSFPTKTLVVITNVCPGFAWKDKESNDVVCSSLRVKYKYLCKNYELDINGKLCVASLSISYGEVRYIPIKYDINKGLKPFLIDGALAETSFNIKCIAMRKNFFKVHEID